MPDDDESRWQEHAEAGPFDASMDPGANYSAHVLVTATNARMHSATLGVDFDVVTEGATEAVGLDMAMIADANNTSSWGVDQTIEILVGDNTRHYYLHRDVPDRECLEQPCADGFTISVVRTRAPTNGTVRLTWSATAHISGEDYDPAPDTELEFAVE